MNSGYNTIRSTTTMRTRSGFFKMEPEYYAGDLITTQRNTANDTRKALLQKFTDFLTRNAMISYSPIWLNSSPSLQLILR